MPSNPDLVLKRLHGLRTELVDLAFVLERRGRVDAADVAIMTANRVGEVCGELAAAAGETGAPPLTT